MSVEGTRKAVERYLQSNHTDLSMMASDVVFTNMATGDMFRGVEGVKQMIHYVYHVAFEARAEVKSIVAQDGKAVLEADFVGKHIGEFAGVKPTGKQVRVPLCVTYDLENDKIKRGRVYWEVPAFLKQVG